MVTSTWQAWCGFRRSMRSTVYLLNLGSQSWSAVNITDARTTADGIVAVLHIDENWHLEIALGANEAEWAL